MNRKKLLLVTMFVAICGLSAMSENVAHTETAVKYKSWKVFNGTDMLNFSLKGLVTVDTVQYIVSHEDIYHYRQQGDKVYRYSKIDGCELLLFDYGLHVGDTFALYDDLNLIVESEADTLLITKVLTGKVEKKHKCLYLRGIEDTSFTDVWVEGLGSLHYGIFRPATKIEASALHLLTCVCAEEVIMLPFHAEGCSGADTNLNPNETGDSTQLHFALIGDSLHVYGYYRTNCAGELYCLAKQESTVVELVFSEYRPAANCFDYHAIDFKLPGFPQSNYTIYKGDELIATIGENSEQRFFPANSIRCTNAIVVNFAEMDMTIPRDTIYYEMWTGNDTIVDGKSCVTLWQQFDRDITTVTYPHKAFTPELEGVIYEADNGYVYLNYLNGDGSNWNFLYDFSSPNRKEGDIIYLGTNDMDEEVYSPIEWVDTYTLHNGEEVQVVDGLIYGIGDIYAPFFFPGFMWLSFNAYVPIYEPINFYRNGEMVWGTPHDMHSPLVVDENYLAVDGKEWDIKTTVIQEGAPYTSDVRMWVDGDTIVDDIRYKKLYKLETPRWEGGEERLEVGYCRQNGDKYYQNGRMLFDFGLPAIAGGMEIDGNEGLYALVSQVSEMAHYDGIVRRTQAMYWWDGYDGELVDVNAIDIWVEGIGSLTMGIYDNTFGRRDIDIELQSCTYQGQYLYKKEETLVAPIHHSDASSPYYDLQGRKVANPTRGIYIKDGRKVIIGQ